MCSFVVGGLVCLLHADLPAASFWCHFLAHMQVAAASDLLVTSMSGPVPIPGSSSPAGLALGGGGSISHAEVVVRVVPDAAALQQGAGMTLQAAVPPRAAAAASSLHLILEVSSRPVWGWVPRCCRLQD